MPSLHPTPARLAKLAFVLTVPLWAWGATALQPQEEMEFDLPAGPLGTTLIEIGRITGIIVSFKPSLTAPHAAPAIRGRYTLRRALELATQASGLAVDVTTGGTATVLEPVVAAAPAAAASELAAARPAPAASAPEPPVVAVLERVEVLGSGRRDDGLRAVRSGSATRDNTPLADLPQSVSVLTAEALALQGGATTAEALRYVAGVTAQIDFTGGGGLVSQAAQVRGLPALYAQSGMRTVRADFPADVAFIERIEVPKGPSAVIGGVSDFAGRGGVVNLVRKEPQPDHKTEITQAASTQDTGTLRLAADLGGRLTSDSLWRLIGYGTQSGRTEGGYTRQGGTGLLGSVAWRRGDWGAKLTLQADRRRFTPAPASNGGEIQTGPEESTIFAPMPGIAAPLNPDDRILASTADADLSVEWRMAPGWQLSWRARAEGLSSDLQRIQPLTAPLERRKRAWLAGMQWTLGTEFSTGPARHRLTAGVDVERRGQVEDGVNVGIDENDNDILITTEFLELKQSLLLLDQVRLGPWRLRVGVQRTRMPFYRERGVFDLDAEPLLATNWDAGALVRLTEMVSVYAGTQYTVETDYREAGLVFEDGTPAAYTQLGQAQAGAKFDLRDGQLGLTVEAFHTRRAETTYFQVAETLPGRATDGVELELAGRLRPGLELNLAATFLRTTDTVLFGDENAGVVPTAEFAAAGIPRRSLKMLMRYRLPETWLSGTRVGLGMQSTSSTFVLAPDPRSALGTFTLPGGTQWDLSLERRLGSWTIQGFINNLFDRQIYATSLDARYLPLHPGRSVAVTAAYRD
jgi:iron complex outermembrane receptor protein